MNPLTHLVVLLPLVGIGKHGVRLGDFLEALRGAGVVGIGIGVVLLGQPPIGLLDLVHRGRVGDSEDLVEVPLPHLGLPRIRVDLHPRRPEKGPLEPVPDLEGAADGVVLFR